MRILSFSFWTDDDNGSRRPSLLCSDISYWIDKPCYEDHEFLDEKGYAKYLETRRCSYYQNNLKSFDVKHSCPLLWEYCLESQKCIPKGWHCTKEQCINDDKYFCGFHTKFHSDSIMIPTGITLGTSLFKYFV